MADKIVFATNNKNKLREVKDITSGKYEILGLEDIGFYGDIPEDYDTLNENALQKARFIALKYGIDCFADDTGLEVQALNGAPGVFSARYAGENKNSLDNINKLLNELNGKNNRNARFRTVIALVFKGNEHLFEGIINGHIINDLKGTNGFGYDPVFIPDTYSQTFAELPSEIKNSISHRAIAIQKLFSFLNSCENKNH